MHEWIIDIATNHTYLVYLVILLIAFLEGPIIALATGFLAFVGYLNTSLALIILILGDIIPDIFLYYLGRFGYGNKYIDKYFLNNSFISNNINFIKLMWNNHPWKAIFFGKMAYGLSLPVLITLGLLKIPFRNFIYHSSFVSLVQVSVVFFIGYNLGYSYEIADKYIKYVGIIFSIFILSLVFGYFYLTKYFAGRFMKEEEKESGINIP